jgi:hypothetical protein
MKFLNSKRCLVAPEPPDPQALLDERVQKLALRN